MASSTRAPAGMLIMLVDAEARTARSTAAKCAAIIGAGHHSNDGAGELHLDHRGGCWRSASPLRRNDLSLAMIGTKP